MGCKTKTCLWNPNTIARTAIHKFTKNQIINIHTRKKEPKYQATLYFTSIDDEVHKMENLLRRPTILWHSQFNPYQLNLRSAHQWNLSQPHNIRFLNNQAQLHKSRQWKTILDYSYKSNTLHQSSSLLNKHFQHTISAVPIQISSATAQQI